MTTISDLINMFSVAGGWIKTTVEPQLSDDARSRSPHTQAGLNEYLGILIFELPAPIMRLLLIIGPPAVGKMTVGREIAARSGFTLFHNHHMLEPLVEVFGYGTAPFTTLNTEFRRRVIEEAARHRLDLIFTLVWDLQDPADTSYVEQLVAPFDRAGGEVSVLELAADLETRLVRNRGESRLLAKPTKRDVDWSEDNVRQLAAHQLNTDPSGSTPTPADGFLAGHRHLRLDTRSLAAADVAPIALDWLDRGAGQPCSDQSS